MHLKECPKLENQNRVFFVPLSSFISTTQNVISWKQEFQKVRTQFTFL